MRGAAGAALAAGILGALALPAAADEAWKRCIDNSDGTNPAWAACGGAWVAREEIGRASCRERVEVWVGGV